MYETFLATGLICAVLLNLYQPKSVFLCFISIGFLVIAPRVFPKLIPPNELWFAATAVVEALFAICILATRAKASRFVAGVCLYALICHLVGWITWRLGSPIYDDYETWLRVGESIQVLALIISSSPITYLIIDQHLKHFHKKGHDSEYRLASAVC